MQNASQIEPALVAAFNHVFTQIVAYIPTIIAALLVLFFGVLIARWAKWLVVKFLETIHLPQFISGSPVQKFLTKAEISTQVEQIIGNLVRLLVLLVFFIASLNLLGLTTVSHFLSNILAYIPVVISASLILAVGTIIAGLVESLVKSSFSQINRSTGRLVGKVASYIVMVFTVLATLAELGIASNLINTLFIGFVATLALGFGLAFGLGAKDLVSKILQEWYSNLKEDRK